MRKYLFALVAVLCMMAIPASASATTSSPAPEDQATVVSGCDHGVDVGPDVSVNPDSSGVDEPELAGRNAMRPNPARVHRTSSGKPGRRNIKAKSGKDAKFGRNLKAPATPRLAGTSGETVSRTVDIR